MEHIFIDETQTCYSHALPNIKNSVLESAGIVSKMYSLGKLMRFGGFRSRALAKLDETVHSMTRMWQSTESPDAEMEQKHKQLLELLFDVSADDHIRRTCRSPGQRPAGDSWLSEPHGALKLNRS